MRVLEDREEIRDAARRLALLLSRDRPLRRWLGYQGDSEERDIYWHEDLQIWATQVTFTNRFWHPFGVEDPTTVSGNLTISVELNIPRVGVDRTIGGVFLREGNRILVGHRGNKINRVTQEAFRREFQEGRAGQWIEVDDGDVRNEVVLLGELGNRDLRHSLGRFVHEVQRVKDATRG